jgi:hypothetical protein
MKTWFHFKQTGQSYMGSLSLEIGIELQILFSMLLKSIAVLSIRDNTTLFIITGNHLSTTATGNR